MDRYNLVAELVKLAQRGECDELNEQLVTIEVAVLKSSSQITKNISRGLIEQRRYFSGESLGRVLRIIFASKEKVEPLLLFPIINDDPYLKNRRYAKAILAKQRLEEQEPMEFLATRDINLATKVIDELEDETNLCIVHPDDLRVTIDKAFLKALIIDSLSMRSKDYDELFWLLTHREIEILPEPDPFVLQNLSGECRCEDIVLINDGSQYTENKIQQLKYIRPDLRVITRNNIAYINEMQYPLVN